MDHSNMTSEHQTHNNAAGGPCGVRGGRTQSVFTVTLSVVIFCGRPEQTEEKKR